MRSCIYLGHVRHRRSRPIEHSFRNAIYMLYLDLDELDHVFDNCITWSTKRPALARFRRKDYLGPKDQPLKDCVNQLLVDNYVDECDRVCLLTHLRYFGYSMNPVSFYFCFGAGGSELRAVVAEVSNTPWNERHCYVIPRPMFDASDEEESKLSTPKEFHVSPFMPMSQQYRWRITAPCETINVDISNWQEGENLFRASLNLHRVELTRARRLRVLFGSPFMTHRVWLSIYWQAFKLWWKGAKYHPHPKTQPANKQISKNNSTGNLSSR